MIIKRKDFDQSWTFHVNYCTRLIRTRWAIPWPGWPGWKVESMIEQPTGNSIYSGYPIHEREMSSTSEAIPMVRPVSFVTISDVQYHGETRVTRLPGRWSTVTMHLLMFLTYRFFNNTSPLPRPMLRPSSLIITTLPSQNDALPHKMGSNKYQLSHLQTFSKTSDQDFSRNHNYLVVSFSILQRNPNNS